MSKYCLVSSGFIFPRNKYFSKITNDKNNIEDILDRSFYSNTDSLTDILSKNNVYSSEVVNNALFDYMNENNGKNYFKMVDICYEIFEDINFKTFSLIQVENPYFTDICYSFLTDFIKNFNDESTKHLLTYTYIPYNIRLNFDKMLSSNEVEKRKKEIESLTSYDVFSSNTHFFTKLVSNNSKFLIFYKFILADIY